MLGGAARRTPWVRHETSPVEPFRCATKTLEARAVRRPDAGRRPTCPPDVEEFFMRIKRTRSVAGVVVGLSLLMVACGDGAADDPVAEPAPTTPVAEPAVEPEPTAPADDPAAEPVDGVPQAIISLSPTATEMLYAIGAGDQVLAVD